jgi:hypothetical protein
MVCPWADNGALTGFLERQKDSLSSQDKFSLVSPFLSIFECLLTFKRKLNDIALGLQYLHNESVVHGDLTGVWTAARIMCTIHYSRTNSPVKCLD